MKSMHDKFTGKGILLKDSQMYNGNTPRGEETFLFQYSIIPINDDLNTAFVDFDEKCIKEGGNSFQAYPIHLTKKLPSQIITLNTLMMTPSCLINTLEEPNIL